MVDEQGKASYTEEKFILGNMAVFFDPLNMCRTRGTHPGLFEIPPKPVRARGARNALEGSEERLQEYGECHGCHKQGGTDDNERQERYHVDDGRSQMSRIRALEGLRTEP